jgi:hypothetical protein
MFTTTPSFKANWRSFPLSVCGLEHRPEEVMQIIAACRDARHTVRSQLTFFLCPFVFSPRKEDLPAEIEATRNAGEQR